MGLDEDLRRAGEVELSASREVVRLLRRKTGQVVAAVSRRLDAGVDRPIVEALVQAFDTLCERPVSRDPGCAGKLAVLEALDRIGHRDHPLLVRASAYRQPEPSWGPPVDTAGGVRILGLDGLLALHAAEGPRTIGWHLLDALPMVRSAACHAAVRLGPEATPLLLLVANGGDPDEAVRTDALQALLSVDAELGLQVAEGWLARRPRAGEARFEVDAAEHDRRWEIAAIALGQSRRNEALPVLVSALTGCVLRSDRRTLFACIGMLRTQAARETLLNRLDGPDFELVLEALAPFRFDRSTLGQALDRTPRDRHIAVRAALDAVSR